MVKSRLCISIGSSLSILWICIALDFPSDVAGIRDIDLLEKKVCRSTVQGRLFISDEKGYVCTPMSIDPWLRCCPKVGEQYSCQGCNLVSECCNSYEYCVSCCLSPSKTDKDVVTKIETGKPVTAGTYATVFDFCSGRCRHNSASVVHENAYASDFHHCFSTNTNSSGVTGSNSEARLTDISVVVGRQGESCNSACKLRGQSCVASRLHILNKCVHLQKFMSCKASCLASTGSDQPAEVADDAPNHLNPGACLYTQAEAMLSCDGSHQHTRRLCPCA